MHRELARTLLILLALGGASAGSARAAPGERTDGQRLLGVCQTLLGEDSSFCDVVTDWSLTKTVDVPLAEQPSRQGLAYTIRLIEGQSRFVLGMTSIVSLDGLIPEGTEVRGIVVSLQRAEPTVPPIEPSYTTVAGALVGDADPSCGCPFVDSGSELTVTMRDELGNPIPSSDDVLIASLAYGERVVVQLDAVYDLSSGVVLPGELVRIQACVQYAPADEADVAGCFDEGGAVRSVRACSGFDFEAYAKPGNAKVTLEEALAAPTAPWILVNGMKARSGSALVTPTATLLPVVPGAAPIVFQVAASGQPNTETVISVKGDTSCADVVSCGGAAVCSGTLTNTATLDFGDQRGRVSASATTEVLCAAHRCTPGEIASCDDGDPCTIDLCEQGVGCKHEPHEGACDDGDACTSGESCVAGACVPAETITCADDGNPCTRETCDDALGCVRTNLPERSRCDDGDACTVDDLCIDGECHAGAGIACDDGNPCSVDTCQGDGTCDHQPMDTGAGGCEDGNACTIGDHCDAGTCVSGVGPTCEDDGNPCTVETCDGAQGCVSVPKPNFSGCDDGDACTTGDQCIAGQCRSGAKASCDDQNPCTSDGCDAELGCYNAPRGGACDDGTACTSASACVEGRCRGTVTVDCDDDNPCTTDRCDAVRGCVHDPVGGGACDDGDACTTGEVCVAGLCTAGADAACNDNNPCTTSTCLPDQGCVHIARAGSCDDGDACTGMGTCQAGVCSPGAAVDCDDDNPCTSDSCTARDGCKHAPIAGTCDDGDRCTGAGTCAAGACQKGARLACEDDNPCTAGVCDAVQGCVQIPVSGSCDDKDACTGAGVCSLGMCTKGAALDCNDGDPCTDDACRPGVGCVKTPLSNIVCSDGNACTVGDKCLSGVCKAGAALDCDDDNPCTSDACVAGGCEHKAVSGGCNDGDLCTLGDACVAGQCQPGTPKDCADDDPCTADVCTSATGACKSTAMADGAVCDDGESCTGCPWPEALVDRGFHGRDARPDAAWVQGVATAALELDQFAGAGTGKASFTAGDDLRFVVLPNGQARVRGAVALGAERWTVEMAFTFRGIGRAGQGATPFYELPAGTQGALWNDDWEYWTLASGAKLTRTKPSADSAALAADPALQSLPLQVGLRANGRNGGLGLAIPLKWTRGTRSGTGVMRLTLERAHCDAADTCGGGDCQGGAIASQCRELLAGDYCTYDDAAFGAACTTQNTASGACKLAAGFSAIAHERTGCGSAIKGVAVGHTGFARWGFTTAQKIDAFLPATGTSTSALDQCNPGPTTARPEVGRVLALSLSIVLSDAGVLPRPDGVPLGELVRASGACGGLSLREIARRAEVWVTGASLESGACNDAATLDAEVTAILAGFRDCATAMAGVRLPQ